MQSQENILLIIFTNKSSNSGVGWDSFFSRVTSHQMQFEDCDWGEQEETYQSGYGDQSRVSIAHTPFSQIRFEGGSNKRQTVDVGLLIFSYRKLNSKNGPGIAIDVGDASHITGVPQKSTLTVWSSFSQYPELETFCSNGGASMSIRSAVLKAPYKLRPGFCHFEFCCYNKVSSISLDVCNSGRVKFYQRFLFSAQTYLTLAQVAGMCGINRGTSNDLLQIEGCIAGAAHYIGEPVHTTDTAKYTYYLPVAILDDSLKMINVNMYFGRKSDHPRGFPKPKIFFTDGDGLIFSNVMVNTKTCTIQCYCSTDIPECLVTPNLKTAQRVSQLSNELQTIRKERTLEKISPKDPYGKGITAFLSWLVKVYKPEITKYDYVSSYNIIVTRTSRQITARELRNITLSAGYGVNDKLVSSVVRARVYSMEPYYQFKCPTRDCNKILKSHYDTDNSIFFQCEDQHRLPAETPPKMNFSLRIYITDEDFDYYNHFEFGDKNAFNQAVVSVTAGFDVLAPMFEYLDGESSGKHLLLSIPEECKHPLLYLPDDDKPLLFRERFRTRGGSITMKVTTTIILDDSSDGRYDKRYHNVTEILDHQ